MVCLDITKAFVDSAKDSRNHGHQMLSSQQTCKIVSTLIKKHMLLNQFSANIYSWIRFSVAKVR
ncbi:hypothetical protein RchiOBHm_Chr7g0237781 [Rosa chinensis]|uniref:Uncharacterized protein n=1 Tax=Rosa chinensis TaxID=74649 RepID=A0A2P6PHA3_ROSCH|nr:hypothetical protein RchiOBHm_Chr7g0237781 [Rosa chinensis]